MTTGIFDGNGNITKDEGPTFTVALVYHPLTGHLQLKADTPNVDVALTILAQAVRTLETQARIAAGIAAQAQIKDNQRFEGIASELMRK
jgi:hypothetical protein